MTDSVVAPLFRIPPPPPAQPAIQYAIVDSAVRWLVVGLLAVTASGIWYGIFTIPRKFQEYDYRLKANDLQHLEQSRFNDRILGIMERNEQRDDNQEMRLTRLEQR